MSVRGAISAHGQPGGPAEAFLDGSKDPIRLKFLLDAGLWDVKVVHLTRDGRADIIGFGNAGIWLYRS